MNIAKVFLSLFLLTGLALSANAQSTSVIITQPAANVSYERGSAIAPISWTRGNIQGTVLHVNVVLINVADSKIVPLGGSSNCGAGQAIPVCFSPISTSFTPILPANIPAGIYKIKVNYAYLITGTGAYVVDSNGSNSPTIEIKNVADVPAVATTTPSANNTLRLEPATGAVSTRVSVISPTANTDSSKIVRKIRISNSNSTGALYLNLTSPVNNIVSYFNFPVTLKSKASCASGPTEETCLANAASVPISPGTYTVQMKNAAGSTIGSSYFRVTAPGVSLKPALNFDVLATFSNEEVRENSSQTVFGLEYDPVGTNEAYAINELKLEFRRPAGQTTGSSRLADYVSAVKLKGANGQVISTVQASSFAASGAVTTVTFRNLALSINEATGRLLVEVAALPNVATANENKTWEVSLPSNGLKIRSASGVVHTYPDAAERERFLVAPLLDITLPVADFRNSSVDYADKVVGSGAITQFLKSWEWASVYHRVPDLKPNTRYTVTAKINYSIDNPAKYDQSKTGLFVVANDSNPIVGTLCSDKLNISQGDLYRNVTYTCTFNSGSNTAVTVLASQWLNDRSCRNTNSRSSCFNARFELSDVEVSEIGPASSSMLRKVVGHVANVFLGISSLLSR